MSKAIKSLFHLLTRSKETSVLNCLIILFNLNIGGIFRLLFLLFRHNDIEHAVIHLSFDLVKLVELIHRQVNLASVGRSALFLVAFTFDGESVLLHRDLHMFLSEPRHVHAEKQNILRLFRVPLPSATRFIMFRTWLESNTPSKYIARS